MKVGTFAAPTSAGSQNVTGVGFQPNALVVWSTASDAVGFSDGARMGFGIASGTSNQWSASVNATDNTLLPHAYQSRNSAALITAVASASTVSAQAALTGFIADGFSLSWSTAPAVGTLQHYAAFSVRAAKQGVFTKPASGKVYVSGIGFKPDFVMLVASGRSSDGTGTTGMLSLGMASSPYAENQWSMAVSSADGDATSSVGWVTNTSAISSRATGGNTSSGTLVSFDSDGFTLNFAGADTTAHSVAYIAFQGGGYHVGSTPQANALIQTLPAPFQPSGVFAISSGSSASSGSTFALSLGASDGGNSAASWMQAENGLSTSDTRSYESTTSFLTRANKPSTIYAEAGDMSPSGLGAEFAWSLGDASASLIGYLTAGGNTLVDDDAFYRCGATGNARHLLSGTARDDATLKWRVDAGAWTSTAVVSGQAYSTWITQPFEQGRAYHVEVIVQSGGLIDVLFDDIAIWPSRQHDLMGGWELFIPEWIRGSQMAGVVWDAMAAEQADMYAMLDDLQAQSDPLIATWGLPVWEEIVGIATSSTNRTLAQRRAAVWARRVLTDGTRADFFSVIRAFLDLNPVLTDSYGDTRVDIRLGTGNQDFRRIIEAVVGSAKPVGLQTVVTYGQFRAGVSKAGDPL